jgi:P4 family phage/plasmid primase-like protien
VVGEQGTDGDYLLVPDDGASASLQPPSPERLRMLREQEERRVAMAIESARRLWNRADAGRPEIRQYIASRGISLAAIGDTPQVLRFAPDCSAWLAETSTDHEGPAILAACVREEPRKVVGMQRIFLGPDGRKAEFGAAAAKRSLGVMSGAACRLYAPRASGTLIVAEGVETALAIAAAVGSGTGSGVGVWASISANGMAGLYLPADLFGTAGGLSELVIAADRDERQPSGKAAGPDAAAELARRVREACPWMRVSIAMPGPEHAPAAFEGDACTVKGLDWLDVLRLAGVDVVREAMLGARVADVPEMTRVAAAGAAAAAAPIALRLVGRGEMRGADIQEPIEAGALPRARRLLLDWPDFGPQAAGERWSLARHAGRWYLYRRTREGGWRYERVDDEAIESQVMQRLQRYVERYKDGDSMSVRPLNPGPKKVGEVVDGLISECLVASETTPCWAAPTITPTGEPVWGDVFAVGTDNDGGQWLAKNVIAYADCLLDIEAWADGRVVTRPHTPRWFSEHVLAYPFPRAAVDAVEAAGEDDREEVLREQVQKLAPSFSRWLESVVPTDEQGIWDQNWLACLGGMFGLCLTADTSYERIFALTGPPGSGKSTCFEAVTAMIGEDAVCPARLPDFAEPERMSKMVGARAVILHDASLGRADAGACMEGLKKASGGDPIDVRELYEQGYSVRPSFQVLISYNETAVLPDTAGAMARRYVFIPFDRSFKDKPDPTIKRGIQTEGAGIALWALYQLRDLRRCATPFVLSAKAAEQAEELRALQSQVYAFVTQTYDLDTSSSVPADEVFKTYGEWAQLQGFERPLHRAAFGAKLRQSGLPVERVQVRADSGARQYEYRGLRPRVLAALMQPTGSW